MPKNPHADFSPVLNGYSGIGAFRFWCQTALPLTYDDSLSYYELLCKVVNYLNHAIEDLSNVEENTSKLAEAYTKLQNYVNDYFDNLDIQAELKNILDTMAQDGTLDALLDPLIMNHLPTEVSNWLAANVNPVGSAVMVDKSLTIDGAAADAKVTGDEIDGLKYSLNELQNKKVNQPLDNNNQPTNGNNGQLLRTNGDGTTEWTDYGTPTQDQVTPAVEAALIAHPEWRATVDDGSLTEAKFSDDLKLKAIKDYITAEMYGAVGDGVTDDTIAIETAVQYAISTGKPFVLLAKTYFISRTLTVDISTHPNTSVEFLGQGFKSVITNRDSSVIDGLNANFTGDFLIEFICSSTNFKGVHIHNFRMESYSGAGGMKISGAIGQSGLIEDIWFMDREQTTIKRGIYCTFDRNLNQAAMVCATLRRINVRNVSGAGIAIDSCHTVIVSECDVALCRMALWLGSASNLTIEKNRLDESDYGIYNNGSDDMGDQNDKIFPSSSTMHNLTIRNNRFENNKKYAVHLVAHGNNYLAHQGVVIDGNFFDSLDASAGRRGIMLERCTDVSITNNVFKGADETTNGTDDTQNINEYRMNVYNVTIGNNICEKHSIDNGGTPVEIKSDTRMGTRFSDSLAFVPNIEANQTSCLQVHVNDVVRNIRSVPATETAGGELDVSTGNYFIINGDTTITALNEAIMREYKEITLIFANNNGCTLKNSTSIILSGTRDFVATRFSSITLVSTYISGLRWIEKSRSLR